MEFNTQPTPEGGVPGDYPGKTNPSKGWIGDLPGQGSEGPTDIPNKDDSCPTCGTPHPRKQDDSGKHHEAGWTIESSAPGAYKYRGEQQGRGGHFDAGHQKVTPDWASRGKGSPPNRWPVGSSDDRPKYSPKEKQHIKDRQSWVRRTGQAPSDEQVPPPSGLSWE
jgi:hypothetical protein